MIDLKITELEANAIKRKTDRRDAKYILTVLNRVCKENRNGRHYNIRPTLTEGYKVKLSYSKNEARRTGLTSVTYSCFGGEKLCGKLINELKRYATIDI